MDQNALLADKLESWAKALTETAQSIRDSPGEVTRDDRSRLSDTAHGILRATQQPGDQLVDSFIGVVQLTAVRLFIKWNVFEKIPEQGSISYEELAAKVGAHTSLIRRFAWALVATGVLEQVEQDKVAHTATSQACASASPLRALAQMSFDDHITALISMPSYFDKYGLQEPTGRYGTVFAYSLGDPDLTVWEHLNRNKERMANFMTSMVAMAQRMPVTGSYDFSWVAARAKDSNERTLIVDVGGGKGHALEFICETTPGIPTCRCAVEDLPVVVDAARKEAKGSLAEAQFVSMDFHSEQPIKGALVYYIRRCLHDYDDEVAADMLSKIREAMALDSRLLIVEELLNNPPSAFGSATDIIMATIGGKERTLEDFRAVAARAGLRVVEAHRAEGSTVAAIECVREE